MQAIKAFGKTIGMILLTGIIAAGMLAAQPIFAAGASDGTDVNTASQNVPNEGTVTAQETTPNETAPVVKNGWQADGTYYRNGVMLTGLQRIDGKWYDLDRATGKKHVNTYKKVNGKLYKFGRTGVGTLYKGNYNGRFYRNGVPFTGKYQGKQYKNGKLIRGMKQNKLYKNGKLYSGVHKGYYYKKGVKQTRYRAVVKKMNNGKVYYFQKNGKVYNGTGWKRIKDKRYHFQKGVAATGWKYVGGYKFYFEKNGKLCQDLIARFGNGWKKKDIYIKVNRQKNCVTLFAKDGKKGYKIPVKAFPCSVGRSGTPTVKGSYTLKKERTYRWSRLGGPTMGGYSYGQYCSRITGSYLFHSVMFHTQNNRNLNAAAYNQLGAAASHGCIRLQTGNAKLIYDIARHKDTKVTIYDSSKIGPFDKPSVKKIPSGQGYDPTDPNL